MKKPVCRLTWMLFALAFSVASSRAQSVALPYNFTLFAGQSGVAGTNDGTGNGARFNYPNGIAVDSAGNLFIADTLSHTIRQVTPNGIVTTLAGKPGEFGTNNGTGIAARFNSPYGLAVDTSGNVYVADSFNNMIRQVTPAGVVTTLAGAPKSGTANGTGSVARFNNPNGLTVDGSGIVYVADSGNGLIRQVTPDGVVTVLKALLTNVGAFSFPYGITLDEAGNFYVADRDRSLVRKIDQSGVITTLAGKGIGTSVGTTNKGAYFSVPQGIVRDSAGNVFVADNNWNTIYRIMPDGTTERVFNSAQLNGGLPVPEAGVRFQGPSGVAVDKAGNLYVTASVDNTIWKGVPAPRIASPAIMTNGIHFSFNIAAYAGQTVVVEFSSDLSNWVPVSTNIVNADTLYFNDPQAAGAAPRFYRARLP